MILCRRVTKDEKLAVGPSKVVAGELRGRDKAGFSGMHLGGGTGSRAQKGPILGSVPCCPYLEGLNSFLSKGPPFTLGPMNFVSGPCCRP